ncbi:hypothetical protein CPB86DRAFT_801494 [Serendipita vermifera]|nr:hypothetical protein CPB86DRAFT_801494 [Serendipita vermifera]
MSVRTAVTKLPRSTLASTRGVVQGQGVPAAKRYASGPGTGSPPSGRSDPPTNWPLIATYWTTRSSKEHGDKIAHDAQRQRTGEKIGQPGQPDGSDAPTGVDNSVKKGLTTSTPKTVYQTKTSNAASNDPEGQDGNLAQSYQKSLKSNAPKIAEDHNAKTKS